MAVAPTSIKVLVIPADGTKIHVETIKTVKVEIKPSTRPSLPTIEERVLLGTAKKAGDEAEIAELMSRFETNTARDTKHMDGIETDAALSHTVPHFDERLMKFEPSISHLPDVRTTKKWDEEDWGQRAVVPMGKDNPYHVFYTRSRSRFGPNRILEAVYGDVFCLKISKTEDEDGRRFYRDVNDDDCPRDLGSINRMLATIEKQHWRDLAVKPR